MHRLTFSASLAQWLATQAKERWGLELNAKKMDYRVGKELADGQASESGAYAIVSRAKGMVLRASLFKEGAWLMRDDSRAIHELWILPDEEEGR